MIWVGAAFAYSSGLLVPIMSWHLELQSDDPDHWEKPHLADCYYAMVFFGVGQVIAGYVMGRIIDRIGSRNSCIVNILMLGAVTATQFLAIERENFDALSHVNCCLWGLVDGSITTHSLQIVGFEFADATNPFAVYQSVTGIAICAFQLLEGQIVGQFLAKKEKGDAF